MHSSFSRLTLIVALFVGLLAAVEPVAAQNGPGGGRGFGRGGFGGMRGGGMFGGGGLAGVAMRDEVRDEIKLTEEQTKQIEELVEESGQEMREKMGPLFEAMREATPEEREKLSTTMREEGEKLREANDAAIKKILSAEQLARVQQVNLQIRGIRALDDEEVAEQLKFSAEQRETVSNLMEEINGLRGGFGRGRRGGGDDSDGERLSREEREERRAELEKQLLAVLSAEQQQQWTDLQGPKLEGLDEGRERFRRGGFGGRGDRGRRGDNDGGEGERPRRGFGGGRPVVEETPTGDVVADLTSPGEQPAESSDETPADAAGELQSTDAEKEDTRLSFNFRFAPWELVLRRFAEEAGLSLQMDVVPPGTLNYFDKGRYTPTEALDVLNGYLLQKGYLLVQRDRFLVVVNIDDGIPPNLIPQVTIEELQTRGKNELVSIVVPVTGTDAAQMAEEVTAMLGPQGKIAPLSNLSQLVITDTGGNLRRIYRLLTGESGGPPKSQKFRAFPLKHVAAFDADKIVRDLFGLPARGSEKNVSASSSSSRSSSSDRYSRFSRFRGREESRDSSPPAATTSKGDVHLAVDERTNSLLVTTSPENLLIIEEALTTIDVAEGPGGAPLAGGMNRPQLEVYEVNSADPREVTKTLDALLPGLVVNEDGRARRIHIYATPEEHRQIRAIINQLDGASGGRGVTVVNLSRLDPLAAAGTLRSLFEGEGDNLPTIEPDVVGRRLLIRGTTEQLAQIKTLLSQLGEDGTRNAAAVTEDRGPIRTIPLGGRDGEQLIKLLEEVWGGTNKNPIRIVVPSAVGPTLRSDKREPLERRNSSSPESIDAEPAVLRGDDSTAANETAFEEESSEDEEPKSTEESEDILAELDEYLNEAEEEDADEEPVEVASARTEDADTVGEEPPVVVSSDGGNLIIASEDQEALDRMEKLIAALSRSAPQKRQWTVFYLRSSDAIETASTLGELFPAGSVATTAAGDSGLMGSLSSLGGSLVDMSGLSSLGGSNDRLRIIPEPRLNALFVSGPQSQIDDIENVLKILDGGELPESLRERLPRRIELEYADVNEVAAIVREVYKDYLEAPQQDRGRRSNPIAMMMGGNQDETPAPGVGIKLTLGVDTKANTLIVSASNALFEQVEEMVSAIDAAAGAEKQTVRVVTIDPDNAPLIERSLGSLFGKVRVSTTGSTTTRQATTSNNQSQSSSSSSSSSSDDSRSSEIRRFFEERMRERMQRGGGGDRGSRRGSFGGGDRGDRSGGRRSRRGDR